MAAALHVRTYATSVLAELHRHQRARDHASARREFVRPQCLLIEWCGSNLTVASMGIDIGKKAFHLVGLDRRGAILLSSGQWATRSSWSPTS